VYQPPYVAAVEIHQIDGQQQDCRRVFASPQATVDGACQALRACAMAEQSSGPIRYFCPVSSGVGGRDDDYWTF
jgi:hypothetical protein